MAAIIIVPEADFVAHVFPTMAGEYVIHVEVDSDDVVVKALCYPDNAAIPANPPPGAVDLLPIPGQPNRFSGCAPKAIGVYGTPVQVGATPRYVAVWSQDLTGAWSLVDQVYYGALHINSCQCCEPGPPPTSRAHGGANAPQAWYLVPAPAPAR